jgi:hypothetical protein
VSAAEALAAAEALGVRLWICADGAVRMGAAIQPPAAVLENLRRHRWEVALLLEERRRVDFLLRATEEALDALGALDDELRREREETAAWLVEEATGGHGEPLPPAHDRAAGRIEAWPGAKARPWGGRST